MGLEICFLLVSRGAFGSQPSYKGPCICMGWSVISPTASWGQDKACIPSELPISYRAQAGKPAQACQDSGGECGWAGYCHQTEGKKKVE